MATQPNGYSSVPRGPVDKDVFNLELHTFVHEPVGKRPTFVDAVVDTRERILTATNELFRRQGFNGTSLSQIVQASGATTGSLYHFFPGGKDDLTAEVLRTSGRAYGELVELIVRSGKDPASGMSEAFEGAAEMLVSTDFIDPCPIGTVAREVASTHEDLRQVSAEVMYGWAEVLARVYTDGGIAADRAQPLAVRSIASIEGGFVLARTMRDVGPFLTIGHGLCDEIERELKVAAGQ